MDEQLQTLNPEAADLAEAEDLIAPTEPEAPDAAAEPPARDYAAEVGALLTAYPELRGSALPDEVVRSAVEDGLPLTEAYRAYTDRETRAELTRLREENRVYRQNAEAASRAPVQGVADTGAAARETDPFLAGFESW